MGENEQGGMLRTVVVVGLVALIAAAITMGVVGMKASMLKNTNEAAVPSQIIDSTSRFILEDPTYEKYVSINNNKIVFDTRTASDNIWVRYESAPEMIPNGSKKVKLSVTGMASTDSLYVHPWMKYLDKSGRQIGGSGVQYANIPTTGKASTVSVVADIPNGAYTYQVSFQSRQASYVEYESATVSFR